MTILVVGGGKVGYYLARTLIEHGHTPIIVERNRETSRRIANDLDITIVLGDGTTIETLERADVSSADVVVAVTGLDEDNLVACQLSKKSFGVPKTVSRVNNPKNADVMRKLGVDMVVSSTDSIAWLLEREVDADQIRQLLPLDGDEVQLIEVTVPESFRYHGEKLSVIGIPHDATVATISRNGKTIVPRGNTQLFVGDKMTIIIRNEVLSEFKKIMGISKSK